MTRALERLQCGASSEVIPEKVCDKGHVKEVVDFGEDDIEKSDNAEQNASPQLEDSGLAELGPLQLEDERPALADLSAGGHHSCIQKNVNLSEVSSVRVVNFFIT